MNNPTITKTTWKNNSSLCGNYDLDYDHNSNEYLMTESKTGVIVDRAPWDVVLHIADGSLTKATLQIQE